MTVLTVGSLVSLALLSAVSVPARKRFTLFVTCAICFRIARGLMFSFEYLATICMFFAIVGFSVAILNSFISTITQLVVPQEKRGKVFALLGAMSQGLTPIGLAFGGVLGEFFPIRTIIPVTAVVVFIGFLPVFVSKDLREVFATEDSKPSSP
jgi:MFS transporter, DHA3 family, macrolide efflux protein